ncbi:LysR family transcriptional regulator protein [Paraburkholderia sabiae]|uniref:LysR family transcriptional regulator n=1 Tax=Paraburkholderia sabiae TaxID=273251 RepID=UPI001CAB1751|nr:LysR family transcriptional regulator [Paraburkholderia sabiae]CAG9194819.1 LysR family transcriptional regulator protein [Paraburkholderia sabiae]
MLNSQWLQTFVALIELGSFTRAAEKLQITQAAVSQHLRQLEDRLGLLVVRRARGIDLTPAGQALLDYCRELEAADKKLHLRLSDDDDADGEIGLITPGSIGLALFPILLDLQQHNPKWKIRHRFAPDPEVVSAVLANQYELGLVTLQPDDARLASSKLAEEPLELVVPAGETVGDWSDLQRIGFIDHPDGHAMANRLLSRRFPRNPGVACLPRHGFSNQVGLILEFVARGLGFTVIPRYARTVFPNAGAISVVEGGSPVIDTLWLIHRAEWPLPVRCGKTVKYLRERIGS